MTFPDMMEQINQLSKEEVLEVKRAVERKLIELRREEILKNSELSKTLAKEGKLFGSNEVDEILNWLRSDEDTF